MMTSFEVDEKKEEDSYHLVHQMINLNPLNSEGGFGIRGVEPLNFACLLKPFWAAATSSP